MAENQPKKVIPFVVEGFEINSQNVTFHKLQEFSLTLFAKLLNHQKQRNFLLVERDNLRTILENTRHDINLANNIALNKDRELEQAQDKYRREVKEAHQEEKYIMYNYNINLAEVKVWENDMSVKANDKQFAEELEILHEKRQLKEELAKKFNKYSEELELLKNQHLEEILKLKQKCYAVQAEKEVNFRERFQKTVEQLGLKHEMEMSELEERKNMHLVELKVIHKATVNETKDFFNSITAENLTVISNLKQNLSSVKASRVNLSAKVEILKKENDKLREPLAKSEAEVKNLKRQLINYEKDLLSLKNNKHMLKQIQKQAKEIEKDNSLALNKLKSFENKNSQTYVDTGCQNAIMDFNTNLIFKRDRLEKQIYHLIDSLGEKQRIIEDLSSDPEIFQAVTRLNFEFWSPKQLSYELAIICKAHDELLKTLEAKLHDFCVPEVNLGFKAINMRYTTANTASLVSKQ